MVFMYGDEHVVRREFCGIIPYRHHGIELPDGRMAENSPPVVRIVGYADFARGRPTKVVSRAASDADRALAVERAVSRVGERGYSLTGWNCEHFATWCATGIAASQQVAEWLMAIAAFIQAAITVGAAMLAAVAIGTVLAEE
jgi:hypothetical protein